MSESDSDEQWTPPDLSEQPSPEKRKKVHKCTFKGCSAVFCRPSRLANHLLSHKGERKYRCKEAGCSKAYMSMSHLKRHTTLSHASDPRLSLTYPCPNYGCNKVLKTRDTLIKHCKRAHDRGFECHICRRTFCSEEQLKTHFRNDHNNQDSHRCEECNLEFARLGQFNRHKRRHRIHICPHPDCFFSSHQYTILRRHIAQVHPRFLKCYHCGKEVKDKALLRKHVRVHLAEQGLLVDPPPSRSGTFVCSLCSTVLTTKGSLKRHHFLMHVSPKPRNPVKTGPERAPRYDKGVPRYSTASLLSSLDIPPSLDRELVSKVRHSTDDETSSRVLELVLNVLSSDSEPLSPN